MTERKPYQLCNVEYLTFSPSRGGVVNTTEVESAVCQWWVPQLTDDSVANELRGVEGAVAMTRKRFPVIAIIGAVMTNQLESSIANQPRRFPDDVGLRPGQPIIDLSPQEPPQ